MVKRVVSYRLPSLNTCSLMTLLKSVCLTFFFSFFLFSPAGAPRFPKSPPVKLYGFLGTETKVECDLFGNPTPEVQWNRSPSSPLPPGRSQVKKDGLYINNTKKEDEGIYTCLATNEYGMVIHGTYLIVKAVGK